MNIMEKKENKSLKSTILAALVFGFITVLSFGCVNAQDTAATSAGFESKLSIDLGLSANATLFANGNEGSPYYSKFGFGLQIPLMAHWQFAPHWQLSAGLRYDFNWMPMYYEVEPDGDWNNLDEMGLTFLTSTAPADQHSYAFQSYVGIPLELKWYPRANQKNLLGVGLDLFAGVAVSQFFNIDNRVLNGDHWQWEGWNRSSFGAMNLWKMEVGLTLSTDKLGLVHGIRFFTNLLPTYKDPSSGEKIFLSGISMFL